MRKPIQIICSYDKVSQVYRAEAPTLGLFVSGYGETADEAVQDLGSVIEDHYLDLIGEEDLSGYSLLVQKRLSDHITEISNKKTA